MVGYNTVCKLAAEAGRFAPSIRTRCFVIFRASAYSSIKFSQEKERRRRQVRA